MVFLIDLPRIDDPARVADNALTHFGAELQFFLERQGVDGKMVNSLRNYVRDNSGIPPSFRRSPQQACRARVPKSAPKTCPVMRPISSWFPVEDAVRYSTSPSCSRQSTSPARWRRPFTDKVAGLL